MKRLIPSVLVIILAFVAYKCFNKNNEQHVNSVNINPNIAKQIDSNINNQSGNIAELTREDIVVDYVKQHHRLPDCYITKREARKLGWNPAEGNICDVLPGHAIGGDKFYNRDGSLPKASGRTWFEADVNFDCGHRNADRLLYSNDGLLFVTKDHYRTFQQK